MSSVMCHMSHVTCHMSYVTCHIFYFVLFRQSGEAYRVCYQRGLPRLVYRMVGVSLDSVYHPSERTNILFCK